MTDDRDAYDDDLAALMRRSDGPVGVRPLRMPAPRRRLAPSLLATAALVIALVVAGNALAGRREKDGFVATASAAVPSVAATATPAATAASMSLDPARALVVNLGGHGIGVRTETDPSVFFRVDNRTQYAVGPKGQLAYWKTGPDDALPHELHVFDLATRSDRRVVTLTDERAGAAGFMVWSTDGMGLAFATHSVTSAYEGRQAPARPQLSKWKLLDLASSVERTLGSINGAWLVPLSWDRSSGLATATEVGRDTSGPTTTYYAHSDASNGIVQLPLPGPMEPLGIHVTSSGDTALGIVRTPCSGAPTCPAPVLWTWSLDDPYQAQSHSTSTGMLLTAAFRPGTRDVYVLHRISDGRTQLESWGDRGNAAPREVLAMTAPLYFSFREDGSAVFVLALKEQSIPGSIVDPDGRSTAIPLSTPDDVVATLGGTPPREPARAARLPSGLVFGTNDGRLFFALVNGAPNGPSGKVCDGVITKIATQLGSTSAVVVCQVSGETYSRGFLVDLGSLITPSVRKVTPLPGMTSTNVAISPDARSIIYTTIGDCEPPAPICKMRLVTLDIGQGHVGTPVDVMSQEYNLGEVRWTALGPSVFKPQRSPNGIRPPETAGTYLYAGGTWQRYSLHRLVDAIPGVATVLEAEGGDGVVTRAGSREDRLSPDGAHESVLALLDDGRILAWRAGSNTFDGSIVTYRGAGAGSEDPGRFSSWNVFRAGPLGGALLGLELSGAPSLTLNVYSIADHTFSAIPAGGASAVGALTATFAHR